MSSFLHNVLRGAQCHWGIAVYYVLQKMCSYLQSSENFFFSFVKAAHYVDRGLAQ